MGGETVSENSKQNPYQRFIELSLLTIEDQKALKKKRGFTDEVIHRMQFRSGGKQNQQIITTIGQEFDEESLVSCGMFIRKNGVVIPSDQLTSDRVIIPYLDEEGKVYHLRPHKLGFKGIPVQAYSRLFVEGKPEHVVLTEGEFKAVALMQWGVPSLAIPGVSSFAGKYFERLTNLLTEFEVKKVTVVFDNEIKDNPALPGFKKRREDRWDTPFWAYVMAQKLNKAGFNSSIGTLPGEWRENGKIDFDMALAQGRTSGDIRKVISLAVPPKEFLESLNEEAMAIVRRKIARYFASSPVRREYNKYIITRTREGKTYDETISNFVTNIKSSCYTGEGVIRNIQLVNEFNETSDSFTLDPGEMAGLNEFRKFCYSKGNYIYSGRGEDLIEIWKYEFSRDMGEVIYMPEQVGRIDDNLWLFGNMAIRGGDVYRPDDDGVVWIDGKGFKPQSMYLGPRDEPMEDAIPYLYDGTDIDMNDVIQKMKECVGGYEPYVGVGWVIASIFSKDIFKKYKVMPILFPHGKRESGKSSFLRWIMRFFGIESDGVNLPETTQNYIMRSLGYFSSLGVWYDEYRNEPKVTGKDGYLRSAYNRQLSGKGTKHSFATRGYKVLGTITVAGEEAPKDNGLFTRCCFIQFSSYKRNGEWYDWLNSHMEKFSRFTFDLILNYEKYKPIIMDAIAKLKAALKELGISDRTAENWGIIAGSFYAIVKQDQEFIKWVNKVCQEQKITGESEHILNQFWDDVNYLVENQKIGKGKICIVDDTLCFWINGVYEDWSLHYRSKTGREPFDKNSVLKYLQEEPYYREKKTVKINGIGRWSAVIGIGGELPIPVKELVEIMRFAGARGDF